MPLHTNFKKKNIFIFFSFGVSLVTWSNQKILEREVKYYQALKKNNYKVPKINQKSSKVAISTRKYLKVP